MTIVGSFSTLDDLLQGKGKSDGSRRWQEDRLSGFSCGPFLSLELWSRLENYGRSRQRRPPYFLNSRLIKAADEFKDKTTAINKLWQRNDSHQNDSRHRDPKQPSKRFHPGLCPSQRGPEFAGEGAEIHSNRRLNGSHAAGVMPLKRAFGA